MKTFIQRWGIFVLLMLPSFTFAQFIYHDDLWMHDYDLAQSKGPILDDGHLLTAAVLEDRDNGANQLLLSKTNMYGWPDWVNAYNYDDSRDVILRSLDHAADGGYIIAGDFLTNGILGPSYLFKAEPDGQPSWMKRYVCWEPAGEVNILCSTSHINEIVPNYNGEYAGVGNTELINNEKVVFFLLLDANGNISKKKVIKSPNSNTFSGVCIRPLAGGGYIAFVNKVEIINGQHQYYPTLIRLDDQLNILWNRTIQNSNFGIYLANFEVSAFNEYYILAETFKKDGSYTDTGQFVVIAIDDAGNEMWNKVYYQGTSDSDSGFSPYEIKVVDNSHLAIGGIDDQSSGQRDYFLLKTDLDGSPIGFDYYQTDQDITGMAGLVPVVDPTFGNFLAFTGQFPSPQGKDRFSIHKVPFSGGGLCNYNDSQVYVYNLELELESLLIQNTDLNIVVDEVDVEKSNPYFGLDRCGETYYQYINLEYDPLRINPSNTIQQESDFEVFPNPSPGSFTVSTDWQSEGLINIQIFDISGKKLEELNMSSSVDQFFFEEFQKGTYIIKMTNGQQTLSKQLFVQ